jgi:hypothetical protein
LSYGRNVTLSNRSMTTQKLYQLNEAGRFERD